MKRRKWTFDNTPKRPGRPPKAKATETLALRMARENAWGHVRIAGELRILGHEVSPSYVRDLMKKHGMPPSPHPEGLSWKRFIHDRDEAFFPLDQGLRSAGIKVIKTPPQSPMRNPYAERFVEIRETLDRLILLGEEHLRHVLKKIEQDHNRRRPRQGLDNLILLDFEYPDEPAAPATVRCDANLGGLLNHYRAQRAAA